METTSSRCVPAGTPWLQTGGQSRKTNSFFAVPFWHDMYAIHFCHSFLPIPFAIPFCLFLCAKRLDCQLSDLQLPAQVQWIVLRVKCCYNRSRKCCYNRSRKPNTQARSATICDFCFKFHSRQYFWVRNRLPRLQDSQLKKRKKPKKLTFRWPEMCLYESKRCACMLYNEGSPPF